MSTGKPESGTQYDRISSEWNQMVEKDPVKALLQYHAVLHSLGDVRGKEILDIGSGNGAFSRLLSEHGAIVTAYEVSPALVEKSREIQGVDYHVANQHTFETAKIFDEAVAINVLNYAENYDDLLAFFKSTFSHLKDGGKMTALIFNPDFKSYGQNILNRRIEKVGENSNEMAVVFINPESKVETKASFFYFTRDEFERASREAGFKGLEWKDVVPDESLKNLEDGRILRELEEHKLYSLLVAEK